MHIDLLLVHVSYLFNVNVISISDPSDQYLRSFVPKYKAKNRTMHTDYGGLPKATPWTWTKNKYNDIYYKLCRGDDAQPVMVRIISRCIHPFCRTDSSKMALLI